MKKKVCMPPESSRPQTREDPDMALISICDPLQKTRSLRLCLGGEDIEDATQLYFVFVPSEYAIPPCIAFMWWQVCSLQTLGAAFP